MADKSVRVYNIDSLQREEGTERRGSGGKKKKWRRDEEVGET